MSNPALLNIQNQIKTLIEAVQYGTEPQFTNRVWFQGDAITPEMPAAIILFEDEASDEREQTQKTVCRLPWEVRIRFDDASLDALTTIREKHTELAALVRDKIMDDTNRLLGGYARDTVYSGGTAKLELVNPESPTAAWEFVVRFMTFYGTLTNDARTSA